jgi:hypothetical protein
MEKKIEQSKGTRTLEVTMSDHERTVGNLKTVDAHVDTWHANTDQKDTGNMSRT